MPTVKIIFGHGTGEKFCLHIANRPEDLLEYPALADVPTFGTVLYRR
jgi:hypothetical protein